MPEPKSHMHDRPALEQLLRWIPGFRGYLEKQYRRESDALEREVLADRLQRSKRALDGLTSRLASLGQLDAIVPCDRLRTHLDRLIGRIRGAAAGYSGLFDLVQVDEALLDRIYQHDLKLLEKAEALGAAVEQFGVEQFSAADPPTTEATAKILEQTEALERAWDDRDDLLRGID